MKGQSELKFIITYVAFISFLTLMASLYPNTFFGGSSMVGMLPGIGYACNFFSDVSILSLILFPLQVLVCGATFVGYFVAIMIFSFSNPFLFAVVTIPTAAGMFYIIAKWLRGGG
jgi:hypothetical protein